MEQNFYNNFKSLLGYFVSHLEWVAAKNDSSKGFKIYVEPLLNSENFKRTGQGYSGDKIQNQISEWSHYAHGEICINIQANFGDYKTSKCYLNWKSTGLNIIAKWVDKKVVALYQEEYRYWEKPPTRLPINVAKSIDVLGLFEDEIDANSDLISFFKNFQNEKIRYKKLERDKKQMEHTNSYIKLLEYKKQIILQGPPGTGKTKLAKEIAGKLIEFEETQSSNPLASITIDDIKRLISSGQKIKSATDYTEYTVQEVGENNISVKLKDVGSIYKPSYKEVVNAYDIKMWEGKQSKGNDPYATAIAKYIFSQKKPELTKIEDSKQFKLIQFHPSYTYEDFVRGIVTKPNPEGGEGVFYETVDKTLGKFAKDAHENFNLSQIENAEVKSIGDFESFLSYVLEQIDVNEKYMISDKVYIFYADDKRFKYKGDNWTAHPNGLNMNYSELQKIISLGLFSRQDINKSTSLNALTRQHATYFQNVVELYREHVDKLPAQATEKTALKNYVLIIDEINRANLSSVLGELIYALEYRGTAVESMYEVEKEGEKSNKLVLPPNLFIIGTMNTADRSVGHIDYAIRRRFAFVDILPEILEMPDFIKDLFIQVAKLFVKEWDSQWEPSSYLSPEFAPKDVMLGHSYFIQQYEKDDSGNNIIDKPYDFKMRVKYEIVPILREYLKDGILYEKAADEIDKIEIAYPL